MRKVRKKKIKELAKEKMCRILGPYHGSVFYVIVFLECTKLDFLKIQKMFFFKYFQEKLELDGKTFGPNCKCL